MQKENEKESEDENENEKGKELILFYNVENFYLPDPDPQHHLDPSRSGLYGWNRHKYEVKLRKITNIFSLAAQEYGTRPFLIGLAEIQGPEVLNDLLQQPFFCGYHFVHHKSSDHRGMDVGLLYDTTKVKIIHSESIGFPEEKPEDQTRDILHCRVQYGHIILHVFVVHLPSRRDQDSKQHLRKRIAEELHQRLQIIQQTTQEAIMVMGDFNANPDEEILQQLLGEKDAGPVLTNPFNHLFKNNIFSTFHLKNGLLFDQILFSEHFFKACSAITFKNANVFKPEKLQFGGSKTAGRPFRTYAGSRYIGGCSDHFPVVSFLEVGKKDEDYI